MLHYYRCEDCLSSVTFPERNLNAVCVCGGSLEYLGEVQDNGHAQEVATLPICDGRCTSAPGNSCRCRCGGKNHGTHLTVTVVYDNGKATVKPADEKAIARGNEYRSAYQAVLDTLLAKYGDTLRDFNTGRWISDKETWATLYGYQKVMHSVRSARTHKTRIAKLAKILEGIK